MMTRWRTRSSRIPFGAQSLPRALPKSGIVRLDCLHISRNRRDRWRRDVMRTRRVEVWWAREVENMRPALVTFCARRAGVSRAAGEDLVDGAVLAVTEMLSAAPERYPSTWRTTSTAPEELPISDERQYFRNLVWTVCRRRLYDQIRRSHVERSASEVAESLSEHGGSPEDATIVRDLMSRLSSAIDELSIDDHDFLISAAERTDRATPLTGAERIRLLRIRRRLAKGLLEMRDEA
jgi:DNA-directed RNA polymerase specialized sigma24 family protein